MTNSLVTTTANSLTDNGKRRQVRRVQSAERVVTEMRRGAALHCYFDPHEGPGATWRLSSGRRVAGPAAELAIRDLHVVAVDGSLFPGLNSQTYRFTPQLRGVRRHV